MKTVTSADCATRGRDDVPDDAIGPGSEPTAVQSARDDWTIRP